MIVKLESAIQKTMQDPTILSKLQDLEVRPVFMNSRETQKWLEDDVRKFSAIITQTGLSTK